MKLWALPHMPRRTPPLAGGYTLVELLVVLCILTIVLAIPTVSLMRSVERVQARNTAQMLQGALAQAQVDAVQLGVGRNVVCSDRELAVTDPAERSIFKSAELGPAPQTNVPRWRQDVTAVRIHIGSPFGAPSSGGSIFFLSGAGGSRVVVRAVSGLTRREMQ